MKDKSRRAARKHSEPKQRPLPVRYVLVAAAVVGLLVTFPLLAVRKEVYITNSSLNQESLADSVAVLSRRATRLRMTAESLASNERIERIARQSLGLEYPASQQIVIVRQTVRPRKSMISGWRFFAALRRSFEQDRG
jgi:cell division protein FtsL